MSAGASVGGGDCVDCGCDECGGCDDWRGDDFWSFDGVGADGGLGADVGLGAGVDVGLGSGGDSPPMETGVAAPRFVAGAIAAMWLAYRM